MVDDNHLICTHRLNQMHIKLKSIIGNMSDYARKGMIERKNMIGNIAELKLR